jgi:hypothetical protein
VRAAGEIARDIAPWHHICFHRGDFGNIPGDYFAISG